MYRNDVLYLSEYCVVVQAARVYYICIFIRLLPVLIFV